MHGRNVPSFFTKKKPAPTGEEEGCINLAVSNSLMYLSIIFHSGLERLYNRLRGSGAAGHWCAAQWHSHTGGAGEVKTRALPKNLRNIMVNLRGCREVVLSRDSAEPGAEQSEVSANDR